jgi:WD repeat-containing protein 48
LLQALLEYWPRTFQESEEDEKVLLKGNPYFKVPLHTPVIFRLVSHSVGWYSPVLFWIHPDILEDSSNCNATDNSPWPLHICCSEVGGRTLYRLLVRDAGGDTECLLLNETVPHWVLDIVVDRNSPRFHKIPFFLIPHPTSGIKVAKK